MAHMIRQFATRLGTLALVLLALVASIGAILGDDHRSPNLSDYPKLQVEAGHKVAFATYAEGVQIYRWNGASWDFVAPEATLYSGIEEDDEIVGSPYAGPTWESNSGSKVVATVQERAFPDPTAIPWLLLKNKSSEGPGIFAKVTYIQRIYTTGGLVPVEPGEEIGDEVRVPYTAWYLFYRKQQ